MPAQERVHQPAGRTPAECPGHGRRLVARGRPGRPCSTGCAPLSGQRKKAVPHCAATAPAARAAATSSAVMMPPAATSGTSVADRIVAIEIEGPRLAAGPIRERAPVCPSFRALHAQAVGACPHRRLSLDRIGHGHPHAAARGPQGRDDAGVRASEGEAHDRNRARRQVGDLGLPVVVIPGRRAWRDADGRGVLRPGCPGSGPAPPRRQRCSQERTR